MSAEEENGALVALATTVYELGEAVALNQRGVEKLAEMVEQHDSVMGTMTDAVKASTAMLEKMAHHDDADGSASNVKRKIAWLDDLKPEEVGPAFDKLRTWVETKLLPTWPEQARTILLPCWPQHPAALVELQALNAYWQEAYDPATGGNPAKAAEWLDRWRPNAFGRIAEETRRCEVYQHQEANKPARSRMEAWEAAKAARRSNRTEAPTPEQNRSDERQPAYAGPGFNASPAYTGGGGYFPPAEENGRY